MAVRSSATRQPVRADTAHGGLPGWLLLAVPLAIMLVLTIGSWALGLDTRISHWDKGLHVVDGALVAVIFGWLLLGWRDREQVDFPDELAALLTTFAALLFGTLWELFEFVRDWTLYSDVQKSNSDTMTDFLWNDFGAVVGAVLAVRLYCHLMSSHQRDDLGRLTAWLVHGPSRVLDRHGLLALVLFVIFAASAILAVWFASRPLPGFGIS